MLNKFVSVDLRPPEEGQEVFAYKLQLIKGIPIKTARNCVPTIFLDGKFMCDFIPTHWAHMPEIDING